MNWKSLLTLVLLVPVLAIFAGIGFLAYQIGQSWDARSTDALISGLVATCGGGAVVMGTLLAILIGIPIAIRMFNEAGRARQHWEAPPPRQWRELPGHSPRWAAGPPRLEDQSSGAWESLGPTYYDMWDRDTEERQWEGLD